MHFIRKYYGEKLTDRFKNTFIIYEFDSKTHACFSTNWRGKKISKARKTDMYPHKVCWMPFCRAPIETEYRHIPKAKGSQITDHMVIDILRLLYFITAIDFR